MESNWKGEFIKGQHILSGTQSAGRKWPAFSNMKKAMSDTAKIKSHSGCCMLWIRDASNTFLTGMPCLGSGKTGGTICCRNG